MFHPPKTAPLLIPLCPIPNPLLSIDTLAIPIMWFLFLVPSRE